MYPSLGSTLVCVDIFRTNRFMSDKRLLNLRFVFSKLSTLCEKRALVSQYCKSSINPRIKTHWVDLEALPAS